MTKRKRKKPQKKTSISLKTLLLVLTFVAIIPLSIGFYFLNSGKIVYISDKSQSSVLIEEHKLLDKMKKVLKTQRKEIEEELKKIQKEQKELKETKKVKKQEKKKEKPVLAIKKTNNKKPKLAIIIDDVAVKTHTRGIKLIPYKVTPSFFPPTASHPHTPNLAKKFPVYMVHVPMEAYKHNSPEPRTLKRGESFKDIDAFIKNINKNFPHAAYYNNHTGSKFTSDIGSMDKLFRSLNSRRIRFLDSKTSPYSKAKKMATKYNMHILVRDVFLDNSSDPRYIKKQLRVAVKIAKKKGYAIAICHPKTNTLKVLKEAKPLLKDVRLVYIDEI